MALAPWFGPQPMLASSHILGHSHGEIVACTITIARVYYTMSCYIVLCIILYDIILYTILLYTIMLYSTLLYSTMPYFDIISYPVLYYTTLYYIRRYSNISYYLMYSILYTIYSILHIRCYLLYTIYYTIGTVLVNDFQDSSLGLGFNKHPHHQAEEQGATRAVCVEDFELSQGFLY